MEEPKDKQYWQNMLIWFAVLVVLTIGFLALAGNRDGGESASTALKTGMADCPSTTVAIDTAMK